MATEESDLWPTDLVVNVLSPAMILNEQAEALSKRTQGIVRGEVRSEKVGEFEQLVLEFYAPAIGFRHQLLRIRYAKDYPYPAVLVAAPLYRSLLERIGKPDDANSTQWKLSETEYPQARLAFSPQDLESLLKLIFSANTTRSTLFSLLARSNEVAGPVAKTEALTQQTEQTSSEAVEARTTDSEPHPEPTGTTS